MKIRAFQVVVNVVPPHVSRKGPTELQLIAKDTTLPSLTLQAQGAPSLCLLCTHLDRPSHFILTFYPDLNVSMLFDVTKQTRSFVQRPPSPQMSNYVPLEWLASSSPQICRQGRVWKSVPCLHKKRQGRRRESCSLGAFRPRVQS